jgi:2-oxoglutarate ferredoxin oxidoreductase subunit alpha
MEGNEVAGEAAVRAGCRFYFGYPITPQNELTAYMAWRLPQVGGVFVQAESEISAINMVFGAALTGNKAMTSSSSPGISLKQEGISYLAGCELPAVIVNMNRAGPGLGNIQPSQADYFQAVKGGGHGDYHLLVLAPASLQELMDLVILGFDLAFRYRNPVMILGDAIIAQMKEPITLRPFVKTEKRRNLNWTLTGAFRRPPRVIRSLFLAREELVSHNLQLQKKFQRMEKKEVRVELKWVEEAEYLVVAFGSVARIAKGVIKEARAEGIKVGLIRPITLWPFPEEVIRKYSTQVKKILVIEMNAGQMVEDVKLAAGGNCPVHFAGKIGGAVFSPKEIFTQIKKMI